MKEEQVWKTAEEAVVAGNVTTLERLLLEHAETFTSERPRSWWNNTLTPDYHAGDARAIISRTHAFESWYDYEAFTSERAVSGSPVALFESAADAIVAGDVETLRNLLRDHPELIRARSVRVHRSTLLHYVGANGIEGFRQHTPPTALQILTLLLDTGAEVDAVARMYGGSTTLGLVATSLHTERAGLQQALLEMLLARGAQIDRLGAGGHNMPLVNSCIANGQQAAAVYLASRGAPVDVEAAGGIGRVDLLAACFDESGGIKPPATEAQLAKALVSAAACSQHDAVLLLLDRGVPVDAQSPGFTFTGANWAALNGDVALLRLFIARGADLEIENDYGGTALSAALWGAVNRPRQDVYPPVFDALLAAGAKVKAGDAAWWAAQEPRSPEAHARILALLRAHETRPSA